MEIKGLIITAYTVMGLISLLGYIPQIHTLIISTGLSKGVSIKTWTIWSLNQFTASIYAMTILHDPRVILIFGLSFLGNITILTLTIYNRYFRFRKMLTPIIATEN